MSGSINQAMSIPPAKHESNRTGMGGCEQWVGVLDSGRVRAMSCACRCYGYLRLQVKVRRRR